MKRLFIPIAFATFSCGDGSKNDTTIETNSNKIETLQDVSESGPSTTEIQPGAYLEYHESGGIKIKGFHNNQLNREGLWISYYEDGTKWSESYYVDGKKDGHTVTFFPNGQVRYVGEYKNDKKIGTWIFYDETGKITNEEKF